MDTLALKNALETAREGLAALQAVSWKHRLEALERWAQVWSSRPNPEAIAEIADAAQMSPQMVAWAARTTCEAFIQDAQVLLTEATGDPNRLDGSAGGVAVLSPPVWGHVWASTLPTSGWMPVLTGLLCGSAAVIKAPQRALPAALWLARTLQDADPCFAKSVQVSVWRGGGPEDAILVQGSDALVVSAGAQAVERFAHLCADQPGPLPAVFFGPGRSLAVVLDGQSHSPDLFDALALDVAAYDQLGCLSPQAIWLQNADEATGRAFCQALAQALDRLGATLPRGPLPNDAAAAIMQRKATAPFTGGRIFEATDATVLWEPTAMRADCPLHRTIAVHAFKGDHHNLEATISQHERRLHAVAIAGTTSFRAQFGLMFAARFGASRICQPGTMQTPPGRWHHDGMAWLAHLLKFTDFEA